MAITATRSFWVPGAFLGLMFLASIVRAIPAVEPVALPKTIPIPPKLAATAYFLMDYNSNYEIASKEPDTRLEPASLTKIMTHYVIESEMQQGRLKPMNLVHISPKAAKTAGSRMFVQANTEVTVQDLIKGIVIESGNDASVAMAEHIADSEAVFADLMNQHAARLGMQHTHFTNSTGLPDPNHYSTARDMAILGQALIRDFPSGYALHREKTYKYNKIEQRNRNKLLWRDPSVDGIKTGFTTTARYCLVASGQRNGMRLLAVVMGSKSDKIRTHETSALLNYGFRFYETLHVLKAGEQISLSRIWMGQDSSLPLGVAEDLYVTLPKDHQPLLQTELQIQDYLEAPAQRGQPFGEIKLQLNDKVMASKPLIALKEVSETNFLGRVSDHMKLWTYYFLNRKPNLL